MTQQKTYLFKFFVQLKRVFSSPKFTLFIFTAFILQGLLFVVIINPGYTTPDLVVTDMGVAPDEVRHFNNIKFYAERPIADGPFITDASEKQLVMGEIERFPSYLYYYLMSFIARVGYLFTSNDSLIIAGLRVTTLITGVLTLFIYRKLLSLLTKSKSIINASTLMLANTGIFLWMSAAINYDIPSLGLFLLILYWCITAKDKPQRLVYVLPVVIGIGLIKYTYIPFAIFAYGLAVLRLASKTGVKELYLQVKNGLLTEKIKTLTVGIFIFFTAFLFSERVLVNIASYHAINPECNVVHSTEACMNFEIFERNYNQKKAYDSAVESGAITPYHYSFPSHVGMWLDSYYISTYTYRGHVKEYREISNYLVILSALLIILLSSIVASKRFRILSGWQQKYLLAVALVYSVAIYLFNVNTLMSLGAVYAYQGRYILPALAIAYFFLVLMLQKYYFYNRDVGRHLAIFIVTLSAGFLWIVLTNPTISFLTHVKGSDWYSNAGLKILK